jgi:CheY-like chemotaxis protein
MADKKKLIMLVEDQDSVRQMVRFLLENHGGYSVEDYCHGLEAHRKLAEYHLKDEDPYSLLLSDITMPEMSGIALAREANILFPEMPIILMTGYSKDTNIPRFVKKTITKPFHITDFLETVRTYIRPEKNEEPSY